MTTTSLTTSINQATQAEPADLVIKNISILNVLTGKIETGDIAVSGDTIIGVYDEYEGKKEIDGTGKFAVPGFIDTHLHIESSLLTPYRFEEMVLPLGTTTAFPDPHEMANVIGTDAFDFFINSAKGTVMDLNIGLSSCVPATNIGTSGAVIDSNDIKSYADKQGVSHLAEVMNLAAVWNADSDMIGKLETFQGRHIDGHMPGLGLDMPAHGPLINAVGAAGILTDHECTTMQEALEKSKRGIRILIREGTGCKNLEALMSFITKENSYNTAFCTDDFHPADISQEGHLNFIIRKAIELYDPKLHGPDKQTHIENVYRIATYGAANIFGKNHGLKRIGEISPGAKADIVLLNDLETCDVASVVKSGKEVKKKLFEQRPDIKLVGLNSIQIDKITSDHLKLKSEKTQIPIVNVVADNVLTTASTKTFENKEGEILGDINRDLLKCAVIERHGKTNGNIGIGFVSGFEFDKGAIAASVGHDDHNITVVGASDEEMTLAVNTLKDMGGGYVVVNGDEVLAKLPLPIAGLMSDSYYQDVATTENDIRESCKSLVKKGKEGLPQPLISLAFISLSVIPDIRICDAGITRNKSTGPELVWDQRTP